ncbi:MAG: sensor domain-containing diguanylate cyclase [Alphaproteobacteria bacterium]|nr:sensor domain-containing diguanylate cyclase [Alphaproteobacteria bacterium]
MARPVSIESAEASAASERLALTLPGGAFATGNVGAAILLTADADVPLNASGEALATLYRAGRVPQLAKLVERVVARGQAVREQIVANNGEREQALDCAALPLAGDQGVLVMGHDVSLHRNLHRALLDSRQRYKDLVECSTDFAWETDAEGRFVFVTPRGTHGYQATDLVSRLATDFELDPPGEDPPFLPPVPVEDRLLRFRTSSGEAAWLHVCSVPLYDDDGRLTGARGVCRDVTAEREREEALDAARERGRLLAEIVSALQGEFDADHILSRALAAAAALGAASGAILRVYAEGPTGLGAVWPKDSVVPQVDALNAIAANAGEGMVVGDEGRWIHAPTRYREGVNGLLILARPAQALAFSAEEQALVGQVADHLGIALEQVARQEALERLSRTDGLTGLLNRRAFTEEAGRRRHLARRNARPAALMFLDRNNFKHVNDVYGHQAGDSALVRVADLLRAEGRRSDLVARLGGDEFALWLDETDAAGATTKAEQILAAAVPLTSLSGSAEKPFGLSIGIALCDPAYDETLDEMIVRADHAMYQVKRRRRPGSAIADREKPHQEGNPL